MRERVKQWRQKVTSFLEKHIKPQSIQMTIALSFTIVSVISMGILGISLYNRFVNKMEDMTTQSAEQLLNQTAINLESYLRNMRRISDAMYYSVIKDKDLATDSLDEEMNLLYEANKDNLISIACYTTEDWLLQRRLPRRRTTSTSWIRNGLRRRRDRWRTCIFPHRMYRICLTIRVTAITGSYR